MSLQIGQQLGSYQITSLIGKGGMGEVYRAKDTKLKRDVAIKILPDEFSRDTDRVARFQREAESLAALNHQNIAAIYDLQQSDATRFLILEYVEGDTLADILKKRGALPVDEALQIGKQICEALEAAHEKGIIHRDLKPANVKITSDGKVKVLDFGLAKVCAAQAATELSNSPTLISSSVPGVIMGTPAYMPPEQVNGKEADRTSDVWAFGCVLYEMLTGRSLFEGGTLAEIFAGVMKSEPDWRRLPADTPEEIRRLLRRCLRKDRKARLHDMADARIEIDEARNEPPSVPRESSLRVWIVSGAVSLLVIASVLAFLYFQGPQQAKEVRFLVPSPGIPSQVSVSPDGRWIAFLTQTSTDSTSTALFLRSIGSTVPQLLAGTDGGSGPFWSPDSRSIAFFSKQKLRKIDVSGGPPQEICPVTNFSGGTWNREGVIVFGSNTGLYRVSAAGGAPSAITTLDASQEEILHYDPHFLPDGRQYIYSAVAGNSSTVYTGSLDSQQKKLLFAADTKVVFAEPNYLLFHREGTLFAQRFNPDQLTLSGEPVHIADQVAYGSTGSLKGGNFDVSQNGVLIYRTAGGAGGRSQFSWFDRTGKELAMAGEPGFYAQYFDLSPDGKQIAVSQINPQTSVSDIWLIDWMRRISSRFTLDGSPVSRDVVWSADGLRLAFTSYRKGNEDIVVKNASGLGPETPLLESPNREVVEDWSHDGRYLIYEWNTGPGVSASGGIQDIYALPLFGDRKPFPIVQSPFRKNEPELSFDGKWLAYDSNESGTWQVYVISFPSPDQKRQVSTAGGGQPHWRADGRELYYLDLDGKLMAVDVSTDSKIDSGIPHPLFDTGVPLNPTLDQYRVTPDGERFLVLKPITETTAGPITVVLNWTAALNKK